MSRFFSLSTQTFHQLLVSVYQSGVLGVDEFDGLDELIAGLEVELFEGLAQYGGEDWDQLGCKAQNNGVLLVVWKCN